MRLSTVPLSLRETDNSDEGTSPAVRECVCVDARAHTGKRYTRRERTIGPLDPPLRCPFVRSVLQSQSTWW